MSPEHEAPPTELEQRLRREAAAWGGAPSAECSRRWRAALEERPSAAPARARWAAAAAALVVAGWLGWVVAGAWSSEPAATEPAGAMWVEDTLDRAVEPLEREYAALRVDVDAVADVVWRGMPQRLQRLFGE